MLCTIDRMPCSLACVPNEIVVAGSIRAVAADLIDAVDVPLWKPRAAVVPLRLPDASAILNWLPLALVKTIWPLLRLACTSLPAPNAVLILVTTAASESPLATVTATGLPAGATFSQAAGIRYQDKEGQQALCHTTSWGVSTRLIGGVIMTHGDDDGLRTPPQVAPHQIVILPMLRDNDGDEALLAYCEDLRKALAKLSVFDEKVRVLLDKRPGKATAKRWAWVKKGVPLILEIGGRDAENGQVSAVRHDRLWREDGKVNFVGQAKDDFVASAVAELESIQAALFAEAAARRDAQIERGVTDLDGLAAYFAEDRKFPGWVELGWSRPTGAALDKVVEQLKALKLTIRNTPLDAPVPSGTCPFTGEPAVETILIALAY